MKFGAPEPLTTQRERSARERDECLRAELASLAAGRPLDAAAVEKLAERAVRVGLEAEAAVARDEVEARRAQVSCNLKQEGTAEEPSSEEQLKALCREARLLGLRNEADGMLARLAVRRAEAESALAIAAVHGTQARYKAAAAEAERLGVPAAALRATQGRFAASRAEAAAQLADAAKAAPTAALFQSAWVRAVALGCGDGGQEVQAAVQAMQTRRVGAAAALQQAACEACSSASASSSSSGDNPAHAAKLLPGAFAQAEALCLDASVLHAQRALLLHQQLQQPPDTAQLTAAAGGTTGHSCLPSDAAHVPATAVPLLPAAAMIEVSPVLCPSTLQVLDWAGVCTAAMRLQAAARGLLVRRRLRAAAARAAAVAGCRLSIGLPREGAGGSRRSGHIAAAADFYEDDGLLPDGEGGLLSPLPPLDDLLRLDDDLAGMLPLPPPPPAIGSSTSSSASAVVATQWGPSWKPSEVVAQGANLPPAHQQQQHGGVPAAGAGTAGDARRREGDLQRTTVRWCSILGQLPSLTGTWSIHLTARATMNQHDSSDEAPLPCPLGSRREARTPLRRHTCAA